MIDRNGHALAVGDIITLQAKIVSINDSASHYDGIVAVTSYPAFTNPNPNATGVAVPSVNNSITGAAGVNPQKQNQIACDGTQVTYVSGP